MLLEPDAKHKKRGNVLAVLRRMNMTRRGRTLFKVKALQSIQTWLSLATLFGVPPLKEQGDARRGQKIKLDFKFK